MAKPFTKQKARLQRREKKASVSKTGDLTMPGSMNRHKASPGGFGKRTRTKIIADSQKATR